MGKNAVKLVSRSGLTTLSNNNKIGENQTVTFGSIHVVKFTGLNPGDDILSVGINISTAGGNVRVKVYDDVAGDPVNLLGESGSVATSGTGIQNITLTAPATVPSNGIVWAGFENDNSTLDLVFATGTSGVEATVAHTYGAGANPFGTVVPGTDEYNIILSLEGSAIAINRSGKLRHIYVASKGTGASLLSLHNGSSPSTPFYTVDGFGYIIPHSDLDIGFSTLYVEITGDAQFNILYE